MKSSSYNLIMSALSNGRRGERPPAGNPTSVVCHGLMDEAGVSFPTAHLDAKAVRGQGPGVRTSPTPLSETRAVTPRWFRYRRVRSGQCEERRRRGHPRSRRE